MSLKRVANVAGLLQVFVACSMFLTGLVALAYADGDAAAFFISGTVKANDCETPIQNGVVDVRHANDNGCYTVFQECDTGNSDEDPYNLRGKMLTNENGEYAFHRIPKNWLV